MNYETMTVPWALTKEEEEYCKVHINQPLTPESLKNLEWELTDMRISLKIQQKRLNYFMGLSEKHQPSMKVSKILNRIELNLQISGNKEILLKELLKNKEYGLNTRGKKQRLTAHLRSDERFNIRPDEQRYLWISLNK